MSENTYNDCAYDGCVKPRYGAKYCTGHKGQVNRGETLRPLRRRTVTGPTHCAFDGCDRVRAANGYCWSHNWQHKNGKTLTALRKQLSKTRGKRLCDVPDCKKVHKGLGKCRTHYAQMVRNGKISEYRPKNRNHRKSCKFPECDRKYYGHDYCEAHYKQWIRTGQVKAIRKRATTA